MSLYEHIPHPHKPTNVALLHKQEQQEAGFNARFAVTLTKATGTMWAAYIFTVLALIGLLGLLNLLNTLTFLLATWVSQMFIQLVMLPILSVGQNVLGRHAELQSNEMFQTTQKNYSDSEQMIIHLGEQDKELLKQTAELLKQTPLLEEIREIVKFRSQTVALTSAGSYEPPSQPEPEHPPTKNVPKVKTP